MIDKEKFVDDMREIINMLGESIANDPDATTEQLAKAKAIVDSSNEKLDCIENSNDR